MPPALEGEKVRLRALRMDDLGFCLAFANDEDIRAQLRFWRPMDEEGERAWVGEQIARDLPTWVIERRDARGPVGLVGLDSWEPVPAHAELGLAIRGAANRGGGLGGEAARLALRHAFEEMRLQRVYLRVYEGNPARRLYERLGFRHEGTLRRHAFKQGRFVDVHVMGLLREEWRA